MKSIAFVFSQAPYGDNRGDEGVDLVISTSLVMSNIGIFFIGDGVFQLVLNQHPKKILFRDYLSSLLLLSEYEIKTIYCCIKSLEDRGLSIKDKFLLQLQFLNISDIKSCIGIYDVIIHV
ncbi:MAG: sulfurtransferase complex subunit TusC [Buchnera aphidicola (Eriosoma harunire)]